MTLYRSVNPATGELLEEFPCETPQGVEQSLERAARGFLHWRALTFSQRGAVLARVAAGLEARRQECIRIMALEMGKPFGEAETEVNRCAGVCRHFAEHAAELLSPQQRPATEGRGELLFQPLGAVLAIMPWNFPFWQVFRFSAAALMAGNVILLKHAPSTPGCARIIAEIFQQAGTPEGVFQSLYLTNEQAAQLIADRRIAGVSLTGSVRAGREVAGLAGEHLKRCVLELGGSDPFVVCRDTDLEATVAAAVKFRCLNSGQSCVSPKRIFIERPIYSSFVEAFVAGMKKRIIGDPLEPQTESGPLAREDLRHGLALQVERSVAQGAKLLCGGPLTERPGFFFSPGVLVDADRDNAARREELFGPVGVLVPFGSDAELVELANDSEYGLGASVWTADADRAARIAAQLEVGTVCLNGPTRSDPMLPFGGIKLSGIGRELGAEGIREFVNVKTVWRAH